MNSNKVDDRVTGVSRYNRNKLRYVRRQAWKQRLCSPRRNATQTLRDWADFEGLVPPIQRALYHSRVAAFKRWMSAAWARLYARSPTLQVWGPLFTSKFWIDWE